MADTRKEYTHLEVDGENKYFSDEAARERVTTLETNFGALGFSVVNGKLCYTYNKEV